MSQSKKPESIEEVGTTEASRRTVLKAAAYITPAVVTMAVAPAFASAGSRSVSDTRRGRNDRTPTTGGNNPPVRNRGGRGRGRGSSGS